MNDQLQIEYFFTETDYIKTQLICTLWSTNYPHISDGKLTLLAYIYLYGDNAIQKFVQDGHSKSISSVNNYIVDLKKAGDWYPPLLSSDGKLNPGITILPDPSISTFLFRLKNDISENKH